MPGLPILPKPITQYAHPTANFKCRRAPTAAEWETIRPVFTELYRFKGQTLPRVMQILGKKHGFGATTKMYKDKIAAWGLTKYTKKNDTQRLLRVKREYESVGKPCTLLLRGFLVDAAALERKSKRALARKWGASAEEHDDTDDNVLNNAGLQCVELFTSVGVIDEPEVFSLVQRVLYYSQLKLENYITMHWVHYEDDQRSLSYDYGFVYINSGVDCLHRADFRQGGRLIRNGFALLADDFRAGADAFYVDSEQLAVYTGHWSRLGHNDLVRLLLAYLAELSKHYLTQAHPQRVWVESLVQLQQLEVEIPLTRLTGSIIEASLPKWLPLSHPEVLWFDHLKASTDDSFDAMAWIESVDDRCGMIERRAWNIVLWCSSIALDEEDWVLGESLWSFYLAYAATEFDRVLGHVFLAYSQAQLENYKASAQSLQEACGACLFHEDDVASLHQTLIEWPPVLRWFCSTSFDDHSVMQLQTAMREHEDRLQRLDDQECMETWEVFSSAQ